MLITFTQSGSLFNVDFQFDSFSQGDSNTHTIEVVVLDESFSNYNYNAYIQFLREGEKTPSPKLIMSNKKIIVDGVSYNGYTFTMASDWYTAIAGVLKATIEIKEYYNGTLVSNKAYGIVNIPIQESVSAIAEVVPEITNEQFATFMNALNSKFNKDDYDFKNLGTFENERAFAQTCKSDYYNSQRESKNFAYKGYITANGNQSTALCLVGYTAGAGMNFDSIVISQKGIKCYQQGNEAYVDLNKITTSELNVQTKAIVPNPTESKDAVNKGYLEENYFTKKEVENMIVEKPEEAPSEKPSGTTTREKLTWNDIKDYATIDDDGGTTIYLDLVEIDLTDKELTIDLNNDEIDGELLWVALRGRLSEYLNEDDYWRLDIKVYNLINSKVKILATNGYIQTNEYGGLTMSYECTSIVFSIGSNKKRFAQTGTQYSEAQSFKGEYDNCLVFDFYENGEYIFEDKGEDFIYATYVFDFEV